ncbi:MAG: lipase family protein [Acidimicrobiales bacterium]
MSRREPSRRARRRLRVLPLAATLLGVALLGAGCGGTDEIAAPGPAPLVPAIPALAAPLAGDGPPGQVLADYESPPPMAARAWVVDFRSEGATGPTAQRAMLVVPMREPPADGFPLIVWGHPTKGSADRCAPSVQGPATIPLIDGFVQEGYAVVAPDYEGLAAEGPHPYLVGVSEGHAMLDAARAATRVKGSGCARPPPSCSGGSPRVATPPPSPASSPPPTRPTSPSGASPSPRR